MFYSLLRLMAANRCVALLLVGGCLCAAPFINAIVYSGLSELVTLGGAPFSGSPAFVECFAPETSWLGKGLNVGAGVGAALIAAAAWRTTHS